VTVQAKIDLFKNDITKQILSHEQIFQRHIIEAENFFFVEYLKDRYKEYEIRSLLADHFQVHINEVIFVGSSKLGFSLKPSNLFNSFDYKFNLTKINKDKSDIDVAIISESLFNRLGVRIFDYTDSLRIKWRENEYYFGEKIHELEVPVCFKYFEYFSKGWFRPDMKPRGFEICEKETFEKLKNKLFHLSRRKVRVGIYKDWFFFKNYHLNNLKALILRIKSEVL
jgi:hypothetical protein